MKTLITFCILSLFSFASSAQSLNGIQNFSGNRFGAKYYTIVNWNVNYQIYEENGLYYISLRNPRISVNTYSKYGDETGYYTKSDLGLSSWPDSEPTTANMTLQLTLKYPDGSNHSQSVNLDGGSYIESFKNTNASSIKVVSVQSMYYNGGRDNVLDRLIESKKNNSSNNVSKSSNNPITQSNVNNGNSNNTGTSNNETNKHLLTLANIGISEGNSSTTNDFQKNYQLGQDIGNTVVAIASLFGPSPEELARREREANLRAEREETANRARVEKARVISSRKELIKKYPDGKTPLSYEAKNVSQVYFFVYSYKESTLENDNSTIYISNVFTLPKYADGTWPFKTSLIQKIATENQGLDLILSGYYENKNEADKQQYFFVSHAKSAAFNIQSISYEIKKTSAKSNSQTDFWGNPNKDSESTSTMNNNNTQTDFWGNPIKSSNTEKNIPTIKKQDSIKVKVDFWGNPIKE